jgi:AraC-like DNA-binding protein
MLSSAVYRFTDSDDYQRAIRASTTEVLITSPGDFSAQLTRIDMRRLWMQRGAETLPRVVRTSLSPSRRGIFFLTHGQHLMVSGRKQMSQGEILFFSPGSEHYQRSQAAVGWGAMSLSPDDLVAAGQAIVGRDVVAPASDRLVRPPPHLMTRLLGLHEAAGRLAATVPDILVHPEVAKAMEQELVRVMVNCIAGDHGSDAGSERRNRTSVIRRLEQMLESNLDQPLYLAEVCSALGVSERTLRTVCVELLGMGPHRYLWLRRMNLARQALIRSDPNVWTVTRIANDHGFAELGRFAVAYRNLFGESPSTTLRRPVDHRERPASKASPLLSPILP